MTKEAKIKIGIIVAIIVALLVGPFALGFIFGGGKTQNAPAITLRFWNLYDEQSLYTGMFQEFASQRTNAKISVEYKKYTDINELESDLVNELAEGKGPDIVSIEPSWIKKHLGKLSPMPSQYFDNAKPDRFRATFVPAAANDLIVNQQGTEQVYAVPISMDTLGIMYNSDYMLNNLSRGAPAEDWQTFVDDATRFVRANRAQTRVTRTAVALGRIDNMTRGLDLLELLMMQFGAKFYDQTGERITLSDPTPGSGSSGFAAADALDFFTSFSKPGTDSFLWDANLASDLPDPNDLGAFVTGQIGMMFAYPYQVSDAEKLISQYQTQRSDAIQPDVIKVAPAPQRIDPNASVSSSTQRIALANYYPLAVPLNSKNKTAAWDLINFLSQPEQQRFMFQQGKKISANVGVIPEEVRDPTYGAFARQNTYARSVFMPEPDKMKDLFNDQVNQIISGKLESLDAVRNIQLVWQCYLNKMLGKGGSVTECKVEPTNS